MSPAHYSSVINNTQLSVGDGTVTGAINALNAGLRATCKYYQSNEDVITNGYIPVGKESINTAADIFEYANEGVRIKKSGIYVIECHIHIYASANDLIQIYMELTHGGIQYDVATKSICVPVTIQKTDQIVHIVNVNNGLQRVRINFNSSTRESGVFSMTQTDSNYIIIKKIC